MLLLSRIHNLQMPTTAGTSAWCCSTTQTKTLKVRWA